jgi:hypothetical protein
VLANLRGMLPFALVVFVADPVDAHHCICLNTAQNDMRAWMRGNFGRALDVDMACVRSLLEVV